MNTRIAIIADIHANKYALKEFMDYINEMKINTIINLGDFVQIGPNPSEVVEVVLKDKRFINIIGNNEISLFDIDYTDISNENKHRIWTKEQIGEKIEEIREIPQERILNMNGINILMIHSRRNNMNGMPLIYTENIERFWHDYKEVNADIIMFGHTHEKLCIEYKDKLFINPGSLGCSKQHSVDFAIIDIDKKKEKNFVFKSLTYDNTKLIKDYTINSVPDREYLIKTFHKV